MIKYNKKINDDNNLNVEEVVQLHNYESSYTSPIDENLPVSIAMHLEYASFPDRIVLQGLE
jgi:hypothetical protein